MGTDRDTRKLRAILSADIKGYSLLMADDEAHTIQTLKLYRDLMSDLIQNHSGRVVDNPGDNLLAEFSSAVNAVDCAIQIQKKLKVENTRVEADAKAYGMSVVMDVIKKIDPKIVNALATVGMEPGQLIALSFRELAESAAKIGELNVSPDLLRELTKGKR